MDTVERSLVLSVGKPYDFVPDGEKESICGCKVYYIGAADVSKKVVSEEDGTLGYFPQKITMPPEFFNIAKSVGLPCYADIIYNVKLTSKGAVADVVDIKFTK